MRALARGKTFADWLAMVAGRALAALGRHCWVESPLRAELEAGLLVIALLALVLSPMQSAPRVVIPATLLLFALLAGTMAGVRIRLFSGHWRAALLKETLFSLPLAVLLILISAGMLWIGGIEWLFRENQGASASMLLVPGMCIPAFLALRILARVWRWWDAQRRKRFLWALTHAQLTVVVLVGLLLMLVGLGVIAYTVHVELNNLASLPGSPPYSVFMQVIVWLLGLAFLTLLFTGAGVLFLFPLALIFAYLVGRGLTQRVETLARAASRLREGDFSARVAVEGEDELAQLQVDFNRMAADLQQRTQELQAERDRTAALLNAHRQLAASVSHELRTPVSIARTYLDGLLQNGPSEASWNTSPNAGEAEGTPVGVPEGVWHDLGILSGEVDLIERLIDDLFTLSRAEINRLSLSLEVMAIEPLLRGLVRTAEKPAWEQRRVQVMLADLPEDLSVYADRARLEQIVRNLLQNSLRHTPPGGYVLISAAPVDEQVEICVEDSGEGIQPDDLPHIWDRFYRSDAARQAGEGAGLGLALVKELAGAMRGTVGVDTCPGEGSTFWIRLARLPGAGINCDTNAT